MMHVAGVGLRFFRQADSCMTRMPQLGDRVTRVPKKRLERGDWLLGAGEIAEVVAVDGNGNFALKDPRGVISGAYCARRQFVYVGKAGRAFVNAHTDRDILKI